MASDQGTHCMPRAYANYSARVLPPQDCGCVDRGRAVPAVVPKGAASGRMQPRQLVLSSGLVAPTPHTRKAQPAFRKPARGWQGWLRSYAWHMAHSRAVLRLCLLAQEHMRGPKKKNTHTALSGETRLPGRAASSAVGLAVYVAWLHRIQLRQCRTLSHATDLLVLLLPRWSVPQM